MLLTVFDRRKFRFINGFSDRATPCGTTIGRGEYRAFSRGNAEAYLTTLGTAVSPRRLIRAFLGRFVPRKALLPRSLVVRDSAVTGKGQQVDR